MLRGSLVGLALLAATVHRAAACDALPAPLAASLDEIDVGARDFALQPMALSPGQTALNPSLVPYGDGALLAFRLDTPTGVPHRPDMRIALVQLDAAFSPVQEPQVLDLRRGGDTLHTAEDPRLLWAGDRLYLFFNQRLHAERYFPRVMHMARIEGLPGLGPAGRLDEATRYAVRQLTALRAPVGLPRRRVEKNWTPFFAGGALWALYGANPPVALYIGDAQGDFGETHFAQGPVTDAQDAATRNGTWEQGAWRGGTPATPQWPGGPFETFYHVQQRPASKGRGPRYAMGYYTFLPEPPFCIDRVLPGVLRVPQLERDAPPDKSVVYPGGVMRRGGEIFVAYGRHDEAMHVLALPAEALARATVPVPWDASLLAKDFP